MTGMPRPALERCLFWTVFTLAAALALGVLLAPLADSRATPATGWQRLVRLFARDATLRRTSFASAAGLVVSACVFFRPSRPTHPYHTSAGPAPRRPRRSGIAGA